LRGKGVDEYESTQHQSKYQGRVDMTCNDGKEGEVEEKD
jgi:hypothetical protein